MMTSAVCTAWNDEISNKVDELCLETHENMSGYIVFESGEYKWDGDHSTHRLDIQK